MKPTTYIIGALVLVGAIASGIGAYISKSTMRNTLEPYVFSDCVATRTFAQADNVAISFHSALPKDTEVYFASGINLEVTESDTITAPYIEASEEWFPLLDLRETECNGKRTLDIIVDAHGLADYYTMPDDAKKMEIHIKSPDITLVMPVGTLGAISADENCRVHIHDMTLTELNAGFNNRMSIEDCKIESLYMSISGKNEYSCTYHEPVEGSLNIPMPSVEEYKYSYLDLKHSVVGKACISAVAPALTVTGPCYIDTLAIKATGIDRANQYVELGASVGFDVLDWQPENASMINLEIHEMPACRIIAEK